MQSSVSGHMFRRFAVFGLALALALAVGVFLWIDKTRTDDARRATLIDFSNSFVAIYAGMRADGSPVPAEFRRAGIEHFAGALEQGNIDQAIRMPGTPGLEIGTVERDPRLAAIISEMAERRDGVILEEYRLEDGRLLGRTIKPSIASVQSCVDCHNDYLGDGIYAIGDVMGAYVVTNDLTREALLRLGLSCVVFAAVLIVGAWVARRENRRSAAELDGLRKAVALEREKAEAQQYAQFLASHDELTGLVNRSVYNERLDELCAGQCDVEPVLVLIDVDDFKGVNDTHGHGAGDLYLSETGARLLAMAEEMDGMAARVGGDEFALVVWSDCDLSDLGFSLVSRLTGPIEGDGFSLNPSYSIGIASRGAMPDADAETLSRIADAALYEAKEKGKGTYCIFNEAIRDRMLRRGALADALPKAIETGGITPFFQPKIDLASGALIGFEALARWHLDGEWVPPSEFVAIAEETRLVHALDMSMLRQACAWLARFNAETGQRLSLSANLSPENFRVAGLGEILRDILAETGVEPGLLVLEVTETVMIENWRHVARLLEPVRALGVQVSLDDFGAGYTSLGYLSAFSFDEIKIDRRFVLELHETDAPEFLFKALVVLAKGLHKRLVAEGIETEGQAQTLKKLGISIGQGYHFSSPLPPQDVVAFVQNGDDEAQWRA